MPLKIDDFSGPMTSVDTSQGRVFLYPLTAKDVMEETGDCDSDALGKKLLEHNVSTTERQSFKEELEPLSDAALNALSDEDLVQIGDAFRKELPRQRHDREGAAKVLAEPRKSEETPLTYLGRVLRTERKAYADGRRDFWANIDVDIGGVAGKLFKDLNESNVRLGASVSKAKLLALQSMPDIAPRVAPDSAFNEIARQNREEREWARINMQMTTESAELLGRLVESASAMLIRWDDRDKKGDKQIRIQLWIAIGSLVLATILSAMSTWYGRYSVIAYEYQLKKDAEDAAASHVNVEREVRLTRVLEQNAVLLQRLNELQAEQNARTSPANKRAARESQRP